MTYMTSFSLQMVLINRNRDSISPIGAAIAIHSF